VLDIHSVIIVGIVIALYSVSLTPIGLHTMISTTSRPANAASALSLRDRVRLQCAVYDAQGQFTGQDDTIALMHARQRDYMIEVQRKANAANEQIKRHEAQQRIDASILQQAKNNLATANYIRKTNKRLGEALQRVAMADVNSMRAKGVTVRKASVIAEYNNLGKFWG